MGVDVVYLRIHSTAFSGQLPGDAQRTVGVISNLADVVFTEMAAPQTVASSVQIGKKPKSLLNMSANTTLKLSIKAVELR